MRRRTRGDARHAAPPATEVDRMTDSAAALEWQWLAGYRIVRTLGHGSRAAVYLGHAGPVPDSTGSTESTVAVKVFEPHVSGESVDAEIEALTEVSPIASAGSTLASTHVVRLLDVAMSPLRPRCLVLDRLTGGSLSALLARPQPLSPGMAVTVLVSVARALEQLHSAGFAHDRITPACVMIDGTGRPVLIGLGHVRRIPGQTDAAAAERIADYVRFAFLVTRVFETVGDALARDRGEKIADWLASLPDAEGIRDQGNAGKLAAEVEERLFAVARPRPLGARPGAARMTAPGTTHNSPVDDTDEQRAAAVLRRKAPPRRVRRAAAAAVQDDVDTREADAAPREVHTRRLMRALGATVGVVVAGDTIQKLRARLGAVVRARRRPLIVGGAVGGALLVLILALTPPGTAVGDAEAHESQDASVAASQATTSPARPTETPAPRVTAITADDPVAATEALLAGRRECLRTVSLECLDGVDQLASPMLDADQSQIGRLVNDPHATRPQDYGDFTASLIQRSGGSALIALAPPPGASGDDAGTATPKPASALVIEGETGWRLREILTN